MTALEQAATLVEAVDRALGAAAAHLAAACTDDGSRIAVRRMDERQTVLYDFAACASAAAAARQLLAYGQRGADEARLALALAADAYTELFAAATGRWDDWGLEPTAVGLLTDEVVTAVAAGRERGLRGAIAEAVLRTGEAGPRHLPGELDMVRDTFRRFAEDKVMPVAEAVHRQDQDVPEDVIAGLAELGCFALSISTDYGGLSEGGEDELLNMVVVTEELSRGSLGVAGSLITRPEIIATAIRRGGTDAQKKRWLPAIAAGEKMCAVAVTEPDVGSDVAAVKTSARRDGDDWVLDGVKTWCTFGGRAEYLLVLARTDTDRSLGHRGLSLFVVDKPAFQGHHWQAEQDGGGTIEARAIATLGYRGMHSFEVSFDGWRVPHSSLVGEDDGLGRGFYLQMQAFASGRLQTAARALGVMQSALDHAVAYAQERHVFGAPLAGYDLTRAKIARMAVLIAACRVFTFHAARRLAAGAGQLEASQAKQLACRAAEWVTREAQQLHGGYGYAEEYTVSRLFVDARVLSIFEGADEVLALRVIARTLLQQALDSAASTG